MGIFEVSEANRTAHVLELKAYDYMLRFDRDFNGFETIPDNLSLGALGYVLTVPMSRVNTT